MLLKPKECERCELWGTGSGFSNWDGDGSSGIAIMAEALGEHEEREGLPLRPYAPAGSILHRALHIARLERAGIACYNTIQCRPPRNWLVGAPWEFAAIRHCQVHRQRFIDQFKPRVIVALGNVAMQALTDFAGAGKEGISYGRGFVMKLMGYGHECCVIPAYHPSFVLQSGNRSMGVLVSDLSLARRTAISGFEEHHREYQTGIGLDDLIAFHNRVKDNVNRPLSYDIENPITQEIDEEDRDEDFTTEITSIQFSLFPYEGIFAPWTPEMIPWIKRIMAMGNEKIGFNNWDHDDPRLKARGVAIQGPVYDMMWAWHHAQPDLPRGLQFVASMNGMDFPWKHLSGREPEIYGCADVDAVQRIWDRLPEQLMRRGLWASYVSQVCAVKPPLARMSDRGLGVDRTRLDDFRVEIYRQERERVREMRLLVPPVVLKLHPEGGYKKRERPAGPPPSSLDPDAQLVQREVNGEMRWGWQVPFTPNSAPMLLRYMRHKGHPVPKDFKSDNDTTCEAELLRLAKRTHDPLYEMVLDARHLRKMRTSFIAAWEPGGDGRVHPNFYFAPATGQLSSKHPSAVIIPKHGPSANGFRRCLRTPGRVMVEFDFKSFHAMTLGFEANCPAYMRAAGLDIHSLVSGECFKIHRMDQILGRSDQEIREYCEWYKSDPARKHHRDKKAKPAILGIGFGLGDRKLFMMNRDSFANLREAQMVKEVIKGLFPEIFTFQENIRRLATKQCHLISRWGYIRWFWAMERYDTHRRVMVPGEDSEAAIAFLPANDAFGVIRAVIVELARLGLDEKFSLVNTIHDSLIFNPLPEQVDELIAAVKPIMEQPWTRLISEIVPDGLVCRVDVARGESLGEME